MTMNNMLHRLGKLENGAPGGGPGVKIVFTRNDEALPTPALEPNQKLIVVRFVRPGFEGNQGV